MSLHPRATPHADRDGPARSKRSVRTTLVAVAAVWLAACGSDSTGPEGRCLGGVEGLELRVLPTAGIGPRIEWESDGCVAVGLLVQDLEGSTGVTWAISLADQGWGTSPGLPATITYGVVPSGAVQSEPSDGAALPLVSGQQYLVMLTTRAGEQGLFNSWQVEFVQP